MATKEINPHIAYFVKLLMALYVVQLSGSIKKTYANLIFCR